MIFPKINLHSHSLYSDGSNSIKQMVKIALEIELNYLAITDHLSDSLKADLIPTLNSADKVQEYLKEINQCDKFLRKNNFDLKLYKGIEIDLGSSSNFIKNLILPQKFDIILFEYLETPEGIAFISEIIKYWKKKVTNKSNFPILGLAHFDPSHFIYGDFSILIEFLKDYNLYFEFNTSYSEYYSRKFNAFFELIKEKMIPVAVGSDAHSAKELVFIEEAYEVIKIYDLESNFKLLLNSLNKKH